MDFAINFDSSNTTFEIIGDFTIYRVAEAKKHFSKVSKASIDLSQTTSIDCSAVQLLLCVCRDKSFDVTVLSSEVAQTFNLLGIHKFSGKAA